MHSPALMRDMPRPVLPVLHGILAADDPAGERLRAAVAAYDAAADAAYTLRDELDDLPSREALEKSHAAAVRAALQADKKTPRQPDYVLNEERANVLDARLLRALSDVKKAAEAVDAATVATREALRTALLPRLQEAADAAPAALQEAQSALGRVETLTSTLLALDLAGARQQAEETDVSATFLQQKVYDVDLETRKAHWSALQNDGMNGFSWGRLAALVAARVAQAEARMADPLGGQA